MTAPPRAGLRSPCRRKAFLRLTLAATLASGALLACGAAAGKEELTPEFTAEATRVAARHAIAANDLIKVMGFETGGSYSPTIRNPLSGAVGLIQFTEATANSLGTSTAQLAEMSQIQQLAYVDIYLATIPNLRTQARDFVDVYLAVFAPKFIGAADDMVIFRRGQLAYQQNVDFDPEGDGVITRAKIAKRLAGKAPTVSIHIKIAVEGFYEVTVNGAKPSQSAYLLIGETGDVYMGVDDFRAFPFRKSIDPIEVNGNALEPLSGQKGLTMAVDNAALTGNFDVGSEWFGETKISLDRRTHGAAAKVANGVVVNYTLAAHDDAQTGPTVETSEQMSAFTDYGVLDVSVAAQGGGQRGQTSLRRLNTTFTHDMPDQKLTWSAGDGVTQSGPGASAMRIGGFSYGTNFGLDPSFVPYATYDFKGEARVPTTIQVLRDGISTGPPISLPAGPYQINNLPVIDGAGQLSFVTRDALGVVQTVNLPYFRSLALYQQGAYSYNYSGGMLRWGDNAYHTPVVSTMQRYGLTDRLTINGSAMVGFGQISAGGAVAFPLFDYVIAQPFFAAAMSGYGPGYQLGSKFSLLRTNLDFNVGLSAQFSSPNYDIWGQFAQQDRERANVSAYVSKQFGDWGSLGAYVGYRDTWGNEKQPLAGVNWSKSWSNGLSVSAQVIASNNDVQFLVGLNFMLPDKESSVGANASSDRSSSTLGVEYTKQQPTGYGYGYSVGAYGAADATMGDTKQISGNVSARTSWGEHYLAASVSNTSRTLDASTSGAFGVVGGETFLGVPLPGSFAIVRTGDAPNIPVYLWNNPIATSNAHGAAIVPTVIPYEANKFSIKTEDLPFEYLAPDSTVVVTPGGRGGVFVDFKIVKQNPAVVLITDDKGAPIPETAGVVVTETGEETFSGAGGEVFVADLPLLAHLNVTIANSSCSLEVRYERSSDPQPRLGPFKCAAPATAPKSEPQ